MSTKNVSTDESPQLLSKERVDNIIKFAETLDLQSRPPPGVWISDGHFKYDEPIVIPEMSKNE